jgi:hypothetical protein
MAFDFPNAPTIGQIANGYTWDGEKWAQSGGANYVMRSGDTMQGPLVLAADPTADMQAATRRYADSVLTADQNILVNGFFTVGQNLSPGGFSFTINSNAYLVDQWVGAAYHAAGGSTWGWGWGNPGGPAANSSGQIGMNNGPAAVTTVAGTDAVYYWQPVENNRWLKLMWGTPNAIPVTISFWAFSNNPGTYGLSVKNGNNDRAYVAAFTINAVNTWEYKSVTIPGDQGGNWTSYVVGANIGWCWMCGPTYTAPSANSWNAGNFLAIPGMSNVFRTGNSGAYITSVTVVPGPVGPTAAQAAWMRRNYADELRLCQRYYQVIEQGYRMDAYCSGNFGFSVPLVVPMRIAPGTNGGTWMSGSVNVTNGPFISCAASFMNVGANTGAGQSTGILSQVILSARM